MTIRYICKKCGFILYEFKNIRGSQGLLTPLQVAHMYGYICPKCGRRIEFKEDEDWRGRIIIKNKSKKNTQSQK